MPALWKSTRTQHRNCSGNLLRAEVQSFKRVSVNRKSRTGARHSGNFEVLVYPDLGVLIYGMTDRADFSHVSGSTRFIVFTPFLVLSLRRKGVGTSLLSLLSRTTGLAAERRGGEEVWRTMSFASKIFQCLLSSDVYYYSPTSFQCIFSSMNSMALPPGIVLEYCVLFLLWEKARHST